MENRYRAYDKQYNIMGDVTVLLFIGDRIEVDFRGNNNEPKTVDSENIFLMQFTGKQDKNGKNIYENDICKNDGGEIFKIYFDDDFCQLKAVSEIGSVLLSPHAQYFEIIGNIYQNPKLWNSKDGN